MCEDNENDPQGPAINDDTACTTNDATNDDALYNDLFKKRNYCWSDSKFTKIYYYVKFKQASDGDDRCGFAWPTNTTRSEQINIRRIAKDHDLFSNNKEKLCSRRYKYYKKDAMTQEYLLIGKNQYEKMKKKKKGKKKETILVKTIEVRVAQYKDLRRIAMDVHSSKQGVGHPGMNAVEHRIREHWHFNYIRQFAHDVVTSCNCQTKKRATSKRKNVRKMKIRPISGNALRMWSINCMEMRKSSSGNTHIYTATDYHSKWKRAKVGKQPNAERIESWIRHDIIDAYGPCEIIVSDNGKEFKNSMINELKTKQGFEHLFTTPYRSQS